MFPLAITDTYVVNSVWWLAREKYAVPYWLSALCVPIFYVSRIFLPSSTYFVIYSVIVDCAGDQREVSSSSDDNSFAEPRSCGTNLNGGGEERGG